MTQTKFDKAIRLFDKANANDPNVVDFEGKSYPKELLYGLRMTNKLEDFAPDASEAVKLAARCQHICRWEIPRESYPMDRIGYLTWRKSLYKFHATKAAEILNEVGFDNQLIENVCFLLEKKQLKRNDETQLLEDVICLVFLEYYFEPFAAKYKEEKLIDILQKTWKKMSDKGQQAALKLPLSTKIKKLLEKALS